MDHSMRRTVAGALAGAVLIAGGCDGSDRDKAGGSETAEPLVLTMAQPGGPQPAQLAAWAEEVSSRSDGTLEIEFVADWRRGEPEYEVGTIEDVRAGKVDMAWVGARVFDRVGVNRFQALVAPLLIDSHDLQGVVFEAGIPEQMLAGLDDIELAGIGVLPGPMRKVLGVTKPFVRPADFVGAVVGVQDSGVAEQTMLSVGATARAVAPSADLDGLDAYEQQLGSIVGNHYSAAAGYVTANVNLWPRPLVIFMGNDRFESLSPEQQDALRDSAAAAVPDALAASRAEDDDAVPELCREGMTLAVASESDVAELRASFEGVYDEISSDAATGAHLDAILKLKAELAAAPEAPKCPSVQSADGASASSFPEGTYEMTLTPDDGRWCDRHQPPAEPALHEMTLVDGSVQLLVEVNGTMEIGYVGTYDVFRDRIELTDALGTMTARWSFDGENLTFSELADYPSCGDVVVLTTHPWVRTAAAGEPVEEP